MISVSLIVVFLVFQCKRVQPIITPRFALCCSEALMTGLGELAKKYDVHIQVTPTGDFGF
jgi:guanine deaminase